MSERRKGASAEKRPMLRWIYCLTMVMMGLTGFAQMPIFKRYYIADIPGMGWTAKFFVTHYLHYLGAIVLLGLIAYGVTDYVLSGRKSMKLTSSAYLRMALLAGIVITGIFRVLKNLPHVTFSPDFTLFIDISHLGFMMVYLFLAVFFLTVRWRWIAPRSI
jgi:hypothetical protein